MVPMPNTPPPRPAHLAAGSTTSPGSAAVLDSEPARRGRVILLNGTSCAGKSTTIEALTQHLDGLWITLGVDDLQAKLRQAASSTGERPTPDQERQLMLALHRSVAALTHCGIDVLMDHVIGERWRLDDLLDVFDGITVTFVGVHCDRAELERREQQRGRRRAALDQLGQVHVHGQYDIEVDTSRHSPQECALLIAQAQVLSPNSGAFGRLRAERRGPVADSGSHESALTSPSPRF